MVRRHYVIEVLARQDKSVRGHKLALGGQPIPGEQKPPFLPQEAPRLITRLHGRNHFCLRGTTGHFIQQRAKIFIYHAVHFNLSCPIFG